MAIIRSDQVWDSSVDLEQVILQDPWYRVFRKLKGTEDYDQTLRTETKRGIFVRTLYTNDWHEHIDHPDGEIQTQIEGGEPKK